MLWSLWYIKKKTRLLVSIICTYYHRKYFNSIFCRPVCVCMWKCVCTLVYVCFYVLDFLCVLELINVTFLESPSEHVYELHNSINQNELPCILWIWSESGMELFSFLHWCCCGFLLRQKASQSLLFYETNVVRFIKSSTALIDLVLHFSSLVCAFWRNKKCFENVLQQYGVVDSLQSLSFWQ